MQKRQATNEDVYFAAESIVWAILAVPPLIFSLIDFWPYFIAAAFCMCLSGYNAGKIRASNGEANVSADH